MFIDIKQEKHFLSIKFKRMSNLNSGNTEDLKTNILNNYQTGQTVIINFKNFDYIDSAGLTVLIHIRRKITETKGSLKICEVGDKIHKLMQVTRLHRVFEIYDLEESAIKSIKTKTTAKTDSNPYAIKFQVNHAEAYSLVKIEHPDSLIKPNCVQFRNAIRQYLQKKQTVIINFDNIRNIDSAGIASLIHLKKYSREIKKKILLVYNNRVLNRLFKLYSLDDLFSQFQTDHEAISVVRPVKLKQIESVEFKVPEQQPTLEVVGVEYTDIEFITAFRKM